MAYIILALVAGTIVALVKVFSYYNILPPSQNINKSKSKKLDVLGSKFGPNTFIFVD
jgi:hypothetical protein